MIDMIVGVLRLLISALEILWVGHGPVAAIAIIGAIGLATVAIGLCAGLLAVALARIGAASAPARCRHAADVGALLSQSDPNAAGRPRPRAPGRDLSAA
ncbi:DUF6412 domain-containing protein [Luethyella okanaganae]|uniref:DUF6412 domain-containing protein n=1 Tax=Luethyella okanaganae TaxID=69372 RepID=A0ABW1VFA1_9MICO